MALGSVGLMCINLFDSGWQINLAYCLLVSAFLCSMAWYLLPPTLAKCNLYMFLASTMYLQLGGALDYFYTANETCVEGGPGFDFTYYNTYSMIVSSFTGIIGLLLFQTFMSEWHFRPLFWATTVLRCAAAMVDIIIVMRWNIGMGISDKTMYMLGNNIIAQVVSMFDWMPAIILTSKLCPKNMESTVYALLAGFQNFGQSIAQSLGLALSDILGIRAVEGGPCTFDNLPLAIGISHIILPLLVVPLTFILIPDARTTDNIVVDTEESNTPGSHTSDGDVSELLMSDFNGLAGNDDEDA